MFILMSCQQKTSCELKCRLPFDTRAPQTHEVNRLRAAPRCHHLQRVHRCVPLQNVRETTNGTWNPYYPCYGICLPLPTSTSIMKTSQYMVSIFHPWNLFERVCMSASMRGMEKAPSGSGPCIYWRTCGFLHHGGFRAAVPAKGSAGVI